MGLKNINTYEDQNIQHIKKKDLEKNLEAELIQLLLH